MNTRLAFAYDAYLPRTRGYLQDVPLSNIEDAVPDPWGPLPIPFIDPRFIPPDHPLSLST